MSGDAARAADGRRALRARIDAGAARGWRSSSCRPRSPSPRSATSSPARCCSAADSGREDSLYVWGILAGSSVGLLATTHGAAVFGRALRARRHEDAAALRAGPADRRGDARLSLCARAAADGSASRRSWGAAGLTASAGVAGWIEFALLRASLNRRIGRTGLAASYVSRLWFAAGSWRPRLPGAIKLALPPLDPLLRARRCCRFSARRSRGRDGPPRAHSRAARQTLNRR